ncbi:Hypothetical predicted protein [Pelobates cultripes]|uniref:Uncharacterized protein n=1 Tax=Pelobates cultripes TaxID=61616 RepID=A0AAD1TCK3_PELCU|nr:Hypothetical predicted protein [Pelobates cultripes]
MGKRSKKLKASSDDGTRRIGDIFLARPKTKMAAAPDSPRLSSDEDPLDSPDAIPEADDPFSAVQLGDLGAPATKGDILGLLKHLRTWFRTDMALLREEPHRARPPADSPQLLTPTHSSTAWGSTGTSPTLPNLDIPGTYPT